jgi:hypothetical protein
LSISVRPRETLAANNRSELLADDNVAQSCIWFLVLRTTLFGAPVIHGVLRP